MTTKLTIKPLVWEKDPNRKNVTICLGYEICKDNFGRFSLTCSGEFVRLCGSLQEAKKTAEADYLQDIVLDMKDIFVEEIEVSYQNSKEIESPSC